MADLATIEDKLLLPENETVAVVHPAIAAAMHKQRVYGSSGNYLVGDDPSPSHMQASKAEGPDWREERIKTGSTLFGLYGSIGEVDLFLPYTGVASFVGTVHIPAKIFPLVEVFGGKEGLERFYTEFFTQTEGNDWGGRQWNIREKMATLDTEGFENIPFLSREYCWKVEKVRNDIFEDGRPLEHQVGEYESALKNFIERLDVYIHGINPATQGGSITHELAREHFNGLQRGSVKLLGQ